VALDQINELTTCHCFDHFSTTIGAGPEIVTSTWTCCHKTTRTGTEIMLSCDPGEIQAKGDNQPRTKKQKSARIVPTKLPKRPKLALEHFKIPICIK
jgi:hypothetical protein